MILLVSNWTLDTYIHINLNPGHFRFDVGVWFLNLIVGLN